MMKNDYLNLPSGWEIKKLGDVIKLEYGKPLSDENRVVDGKYPFYGANGEKGRTNQFYYDKKSIIVGRKGSAGEINLTEEKFWPLDVSYFVTFDENHHNLTFLFHLLSSLELPNLAKGVKPGINRNEVYDIEVALPPLAEQERIVTILEEAFAAIAQAKNNAEQNLKNAKALFESYLQGIFEKKGADWDEKMLGEVCMYDKISNKSDNLPYIGLEDIESNTGRFIGSIEPKSVKSTTFYFNNQYVLYGRLRPYLNKVLLPNFEGHCSTEIFPIKPKKGKVDRVFLYHWLISKETMNKINATWTGATLPRANMNTVLTFKMNIPPLSEQQNIVQKLDALSAETQRLATVYRQKLEDLESLKKAVLLKAFSGGFRGK